MFLHIVTLVGVRVMKRIKVPKIDFDDFEDDDFYSREVRQQELEDDELEPWEAAWMRGYDEAG
jgi:hypothetical protein